MKELNEYNNKKQNKYKIIDENQIIENLNKENISKFDSILNHINSNWILYIIILFLSLELIYYKYLYNKIAQKNKIDAKENKINKNINNNKNNCINDNEKKINEISNKEQQLFKNLTFNNKTVLLKNKINQKVDM